MLGHAERSGGAELGAEDRDMQEEELEQERGHQCWRVVRLFYESLAEFNVQREAYDARVLEIARERGTPREALRLTAELLGSLLDFKALERLRDGGLFELKDLCHQIFRSNNQTDALDRFVSDIFHEISILKEEHYTVKIYAPMHERAEDQEFLQIILDDAHEIFPKKMLHAATLFARARDALERHLPAMTKYPIVVRSLWLERDGFIATAYRDGIRHFYRLMYLGGAAEGFFAAGSSFLDSGFVAQALEAWNLAEAELAVDAGIAASELLPIAGGPGVLDPSEREQLHATIRAGIDTGRQNARALRAPAGPAVAGGTVEIAPGGAAR